jgi:hypothetical protein
MSYPEILTVKELTKMRFFTIKISCTSSWNAQNITHALTWGYWQFKAILLLFHSSLFFTTPYCMEND